MFKKSPSRNQRSKGVKTKHVLQICLLLGVCFWLIYQVKHSHDKRKEFDEKDAKASVKTQIDDVILNFGRKDLPRVEASKNYEHEEEEEEEKGVDGEHKHDEEQEERAKSLEEEEQEGASKHEEDEQEETSKHEEEEQEEASKHEEEEQEEASKHEEEEQEEEGGKHDDEEQEAENKDEETEEEGRGVGDDEVDENEQERADGEAEHEEEFIEGEKERDAEGDDKETEEKENEEREGQDESDNSANDQNDDGDGRNAHEAREEHYKADDASSAVSHDTQIINSETEKFETENSYDNSTMNASEQESRANTTKETNGDENKSDLKVDEGKHSEGSSSSNVTYTKENDHETVSSNSENVSLPNTTNTTDFFDQVSSNSTEAIKETGNKPGEENTEMPVSLQNGTATVDGRVTEENYKEQANEMISKSVQSDSNTVDSSKLQNVDSATRESSDSSTNAESRTTEDVAKVNATAEGDSFGSSHIKEVTDSTHSQKLDGDNESGGTDESSDSSFSNVSVDEGQHDPIDTSDNTLPQEEKDARVDLSTLPDIRTEGSNIEDAAAE